MTVDQALKYMDKWLEENEVPEGLGLEAAAVVLAISALELRETISVIFMSDDEMADLETALADTRHPHGGPRQLDSKEAAHFYDLARRYTGELLAEVRRLRRNLPRSPGKP